MGHTMSGHGQGNPLARSSIRLNSEPSNERARDVAAILARDEKTYR